jgi:DNA-binding NarL/FixJ family response regulator
MKYRILIMDNTTALRNPWKRVLNENYDTTEVIGGFEALTRLKSTSYLAVIVNISLIQLNGVDAIGKIRNKFPEIPIIIIYDQKDIRNLKQALAYGVQNYLPIPVDPTNLLAALSKFTSRMPKQQEDEEEIPAADENTADHNQNASSVSSPKNGKDNYVDIEAQFYEGLSAIASNNIEKAIKIYKDILSVTSIKKEAWLRYVEETLFHLGQCYSRIKDFEKSNKCYSDFITRAPHHNCVKEALLYLGRNHEAMNEPEKASGYYKRVINMRPFDSFSTQARKFLEKIIKT